MIGELFKMMAGVDIVQVPRRGAGPALNDLIGAQVQVMFGTMPASIQHIRGGKLLALAATTGTRSEALPDIPTVSEFVPGYEGSTWYGVGAPKNTLNTERSSFPNQNVKRVFTFTLIGDELKIDNPGRTAGGRAVTVWRRAR